MFKTLGPLHCIRWFKLYDIHHTLWLIDTLGVKIPGRHIWLVLVVCLWSSHSWNCSLLCSPTFLLSFLIVSFIIPDTYCASLWHYSCCCFCLCYWFLLLTIIIVVVSSSCFLPSSRCFQRSQECFHGWSSHPHSAVFPKQQITSKEQNDAKTEPRTTHVWYCWRKKSCTIGF